MEQTQANSCVYMDVWISKQTCGGEGPVGGMVTWLRQRGITLCELLPQRLKTWHTASQQQQ